MTSSVILKCILKHRSKILMHIYVKPRIRNIEIVLKMLFG